MPWGAEVVVDSFTQHVFQAWDATSLLIFFCISDLQGSTGGSATFLGSLFLGLEIPDNEQLQGCISNQEKKLNPSLKYVLILAPHTKGSNTLPILLLESQVSVWLGKPHSVESGLPSEVQQ